MVRWVSCADLLKKGSCWYAVEISLRLLNLEDEILKTFLGTFRLTLYNLILDAGVLDAGARLQRANDE